jgi:hypothetical protein
MKTILEMIGGMFALMVYIVFFLTSGLRKDNK